MKRVAIVTALSLAVLRLCGPAWAQNTKLMTEEATIPSGQEKLQIYVRNKRPADITTFSPERTVVFVHGATYPASTTFDLELDGLSWMDYIASRGFDVYLIDLPGYGRSSRPAEMDQSADLGQPIETTAQAVADYGAVVDWVLARRHLKKLDVMGWSWGTTIVGGYASEHPDKVDRLVLYACEWLSHTKPPAGDAARLGSYRLVSSDAALKRWLNGVPPENQKSLIPDGWFDQWQKATWATDPKAANSNELRAPNGIIKDLHDYWMSGKPTYDPSKITVPTLMIQAEWDHDTPPYMSQALFPLLTGAPWKEYVLIGAGTHTVMMEKNRMQLFSAVQNFLDEPGP